MGVSTPVASKANGLTTVFNVITAPREAFQTLREAPTWGWAYLVVLVLGMVGQYLATPAAIHAMQASWPQQIAANPSLAGMTPEQQQRALNFSVGIVRWSWAFTPFITLIVVLLQTVILVVFKAIGKGDAGFKQLWCVAMNVAVVGFGIYSVLAGLIAIVRGPATAQGTAPSAMPSRVAAD